MVDRRRPLRWIGAAAVVLCAGGCVPSLEGNVPREPRTDVPSSFRAGATSTTSIAQQKWAQFFASPELRQLIELALANDQELAIQRQELVIAKSEVTARRGEYLPRLDAGVGVGVEKVGSYTSQGKSDDANGVPENLGDFAFGLHASWEVDVWGKLRSAARAADLRYAATVEARRFLITELIAEIARSYYELIALDNRIEILKRNISVQKDALEVVKLEKQAARVTELAVQRFEAEVLKNESRLFDLQQQETQIENRINFLVGRYPQPVVRSAGEFDQPVADTVPAGLPSALLENRPDVRAALLELEASKLDVAAAKRAFYPSLQLDAQVGYRAFNAAHLVDTPASLVYGLAAGITAPLLNRAAITAQYRAANARQIQAVLEYEKTTLQAFTDVVNQLSMLDNLRQGYATQAKEVDTLQHAVDVSVLLFQSADADYMEVLLTRRDLLDAEMDLVETKLRQFLAIVNVYQALGGGWRE